MKYPINMFTITLLVSCVRETPLQLDGYLSYEVAVFTSDSTAALTVKRPLPAARVMLTSLEYADRSGRYKTHYGQTDSSGVAIFDSLAVGEYVVYVSKEISDNARSVFYNGGKTITLPQKNPEIDSIIIMPINKANVVINELYYCGPPNRNHYVYDQFIELYNASEQTVYLDGMFLCRTAVVPHPEMETIGYVQTLNIFKFPGQALSGRDYPLEPGAFIVIAQDAINHTQFVEKSIDLSAADWEFYNPYSGDIDNPAPNVENIIPEKTGDFSLNLTSNAIILTDGTEWEWGEINENGVHYLHIPVQTVIDGVECRSNPETAKALTARIDAGIAGVGIAKYSGFSVQRRTPGYDTNNSRVDFVNLKHPTPGYQTDQNVLSNEQTDRGEKGL